MACVYDGLMSPPRIRSRRSHTLSLAVLVLACGCSSLPGRRDVSSWFEARGADLMDIASVRVGLGVGLGGYARATHIVQLGFMSRGPADVRSIEGPATDSGAATRPRAVPVWMFGTWGRYGGAWWDSTREIMLPGYSVRDVRREVLAGRVSPDGLDDPWRSSFGVGVHAILLGLEAEVRPFEAIDFVGAFFGLDPSGDDVPIIDLEDQPSASSSSASDSTS